MSKRETFFSILNERCSRHVIEVWRVEVNYIPRTHSTHISPHIITFCTISPAMSKFRFLAIFWSGILEEFQKLASLTLYSRNSLHPSDLDNQISNKYPKQQKRMLCDLLRSGTASGSSVLGCLEHCTRAMLQSASIIYQIIILHVETIICPFLYNYSQN